MARIHHKRSRKYLLILAFFATFTLLFYGPALAAEGAHETGHGADRSGDLMDLLYRFINFALLVIILFIAIKKSGLKDTLSNRIEEIRQKLDGLKKEKEKSESRYREVEKELRDFEEKRRDIIEEFKKEGLTEKERIISEAKERARQIIENAELTIQQELQSAKDRLRREVVDLAAQKAQEIIGKEIKDKDQDQLVDEFIERVGKIH